MQKLCEPVQLPGPLVGRPVYTGLDTKSVVLGTILKWGSFYFYLFTKRALWMLHLERKWRRIESSILYISYLYFIYTETCDNLAFCICGTKWEIFHSKNNPPFLKSWCYDLFGMKEDEFNEAYIRREEHEGEIITPRMLIPFVIYL